MDRVDMAVITDKVADAIKNGGFNVCGECDHCNFDECEKCEKKNTTYDLIDIIASLHNELYREVHGKYYDYMYHWANFGYGGFPDDGLFKEGRL